MNSWQISYDTFTAEGVVTNLTFWTIWIILGMFWVMFVKGEHYGISKLSIFLMCLGIPATGLIIVWLGYWLWITSNSSEIMGIGFTLLVAILSLISNATPKV